MSLENALLAHKEKGKNRPEAIKEVMASSAQRLIDEKVGAQALAKGDTLPAFNLRNALGQELAIYDLLEKGPMIISFYRGAWCPYCNLELRAYNDIMEDINGAGGQLVAISPELPDTSISLVEKHALKFEVLSDVDNLIAKKLGLVFQVDDALLKVYKDFGINMEGAQGNDKNELPLPATYVIGMDGKVLLAHVETDYTKRLEPILALEVLRKHQ